LIAGFTSRYEIPDAPFQEGGKRRSIRKGQLLVHFLQRGAVALGSSKLERMCSAYVTCLATSRIEIYSLTPPWRRASKFVSFGVARLGR
jgi:hypothetical protein